MGGANLPGPLRAVAKGVFLTASVWSMADKRKTEAVARWCAWQIWRRTLRSEIEVQMLGGSWLICPPWSQLGAMVVAIGSNEPVELDLLARCVLPGELVIDVGANIGVYTIALAGLKTKVAAIEPSDPARTVLIRSICRNAFCETITVFPCALSNYEGCARFTRDGDVGNHLVSEHDADAATVRVTTLDSLTTDNFFDRPVALVKIDAEGHDDQVVQGSLETFRRDRPLVMVEAWNRSSEVCKRLEALEYEVLADRGQNIIFAHRERIGLFQERLRSKGSPAVPPVLRWTKTPSRSSASSRREASGVGNPSQARMKE